MSRPSITTAPAVPSSRCLRTIHCRTAGCTDTRDAASVTSFSRMRRETSVLSSFTRLPSICGSSVIFDINARSTRTASSSTSTSFSMAFSARARYMAPLSMLRYPNRRARREASVLLPAPAGPSMAITNPRRAGASAIAPPWFRLSRAMILPRSFAYRCFAGMRDGDQCSRLAGSVRKFAGSQQRANHFGHSGAGGEGGKEVLNFFLGRGHDRVQILRNQRGQSLSIGNAYTLVYRLGRPAIVQVPHLTRLPIALRLNDLQRGAQFCERAIKSHLRQSPAQFFAKLPLRHCSTFFELTKNVFRQWRSLAAFSAANRLFRLSIAGEGIEIRENLRGKQQHST